MLILEPEKLEALCRSFRELRESLEKAEGLLADIVSLKIAEAVLKNEDLSILKEIGLPKKSINSLEKIIEEYNKLKEASPSEELKVLIDEMRRTHLAREIIAQVRDILGDYEGISRILGIKEIPAISNKITELKEGEQKIEEPSVEKLSRLREKADEALSLLNSLSTDIEKLKIEVFDTGKISINHKKFLEALSKYIEVVGDILPYESFVKTLSEVQTQLGRLAIFKDLPPEYAEKLVGTLKELFKEYDKLKEFRPSEELKVLIDEMRRTHLAREIIEHVRKYLKDYNKAFKMLKLEDASEVLEKLEDLKRGVDSLGKESLEKLDVEELKKIAEEGGKALALLNSLSSDVEKAIKEEASSGKITFDYDAAIKGLKEYIKLVSRVLPYEPLAELLLKAHNRVKDFDVVRRVRVSVAEGWIPSKHVENFKELLESTVPRVLYMRTRKALQGEPVPRLIQLKGFRGQIAKITLMRGVPSYWEIDPTLIFTALFTIMYGMMFGDIGLGAIIALFGILIRRAKEGFLGMSKAGIKALSTLSLLCGVSAIIFGALYGVSFLVEIWEPILLSPLHNLGEIIGMALLFGALQLILSMILNIVNCLRMGERFEAIFGARGVAGLIFYISGAYIAYNIIISGFNLGVAVSSSLLPVTAVVIGMMALIPLAFISKGVMTKHSEYMIHGVIEILELIIEYPANSLSYIRLAAFALAHEAFGILAEALAGFLGYAPSILFSNVLVLMIEGFAVGIQALRLTYYEFSTKFFKGEGILFEPITVPASTKTS